MLQQAAAGCRSFISPCSPQPQCSAVPWLCPACALPCVQACSALGGRRRSPHFSRGSRVTRAPGLAGLGPDILLIGDMVAKAGCASVVCRRCVMTDRDSAAGRGQAGP